MPARETLTAIDETLAAQPTAMDRLDPAPVPAPARPPRRPARRKGDIETATFGELKQMPDALRKGTLAATALRLARELDDAALVPGAMTARDTAGHARELRQHMNDLHAQAPGERKGDLTDEVRERRERRLAAAE